MSNGAEAGVAAAAGAAAAEMLRQEEEEMTEYSDKDLREGWEFKILRANIAAFRDPQVLKQACEEEAQAGWILVEKFDDQRLRFKRPATAKDRDNYLSFDAYRTRSTIQDAKKFTRIIVGITIVVVLLAVVAVVLIIKY